MSIPAEDTVPVGPSSPGIAELTAKADSIATSVNAITTALQKELVASGGVADLRKTLALIESADAEHEPAGVGVRWDCGGAEPAADVDTSVAAASNVGRRLGEDRLDAEELS